MYVYKAHKKSMVQGKTASRVRAIWGRITRVHGNRGAVKAKFSRNLPPQAMGKRVRVVRFKNLQENDLFCQCKTTIIAQEASTVVKY